MRRIAMFIFLSMLIMPLASAYGVTFYNPAWNPQDGMLLEKVDANKPYQIDLDAEDLALKKITFIVKEDATTAGITAYHLMTIPTSLPDIEAAYEFNELKFGGFATHQVSKLIIDFVVSKDWLTEEKVSRDTIALHWHNPAFDSWDELPTSIVKDDDSFVYYTATVDQGARYFVIARSVSGATVQVDVPVVEAAPAAKPEPAQPSPETQTAEEPEVVVAQPSPAASTVSAAPEPVPIPESAAEPDSQPINQGSDLKYWFYGFLVLLLLVVIYYIINRAPAPGVDKEIYKYIKESKSHGKSKEQIRKRLLEVGWHHERVDKALSKHNFPPHHEVRHESVKESSKAPEKK